MTLVRLYEGRNEMDAHHVRAILETQGIAATVMGESLLETVPQPPTLNMQPTVWVHDKDVERALAIVGEVRAEASPPPDWACPGCGESVEGQFSVCWNCGTPQTNVDTAYLQTRLVNWKKVA